MTVIAWDGRFLVADRLADTAGHKFQVCKIRLAKDIYSEDTAVAISGKFGAFDKLYDYAIGKVQFPSSQEKDDWARLIVVTRGKLHWIEDVEGKIQTSAKFIAFGSGRDYALGAMQMGATALEAVRATSKLCVDVGLGVSIYDSATYTLEHLDE